MLFQALKIALLNVGEEVIKGSKLVQETAELLAANNQFNYIGFLEGDQLISGQSRCNCLRWLYRKYCIKDGRRDRDFYSQLKVLMGLFLAKNKPFLMEYKRLCQ